MKRIELPTPSRKQAIASLQRYFEEHFDRELGDLPAGLLLDYVLDEVGALVYNRAIADAQARLSVRLADLSGELYAEEFTYWPNADARRRKRS
ncbi:MAG: DUF2164 domain-containing protein [Acidobacteriaceae bacterium]|nr:DUF2164 domain-containing protein [Acidobacteriaceae bacterium]